SDVCMDSLYVYERQKTGVLQWLCPVDCREETYPCTRMYSVHRPIKRCIHSLCLYSLPRVYMINKEICVRTVCQQEEALKAEICREKSGWPKRVQRSIRRRCYR
uniref:Microfibril associated protein 5 n=1 Tax=Electrophorus electricus TaxID=8005 RepID=A0A4W4FQS5_ELEEL